MKELIYKLTILIGYIGLRLGLIGEIRSTPERGITFHLTKRRYEIR